MKFEVDILIET